MQYPLIIGFNTNERTLFQAPIFGTAVANETEYEEALTRGYGDYADEILAEYPATEQNTWADNSVFSGLSSEFPHTKTQSVSMDSSDIYIE